MATPAALLPAAKRQLLDDLTEGLDAQALVWLSGYAAGLAARNGAALPDEIAAPAAAAEATPALTVLYGSQTGNARRWAERIAAESRAGGFAVTLASLGDYKPRDLAKEGEVLFVISTQGDGEPPDDALDFMEFLHSKRAPRLEALHYAVLALGDSSYPEFCATGRALDERLCALGAKSFVGRADCDLDIGAVAEPWWQRTREDLRARVPEASVPTHIASVTPLKRMPVHDRAHPFSAPVLVNQRITGRGTEKDVRHLELSLAGSGLRYRPGDSAGVWHRNPGRAVNDVLDALRLGGESEVEQGGETFPLRHWLEEKREVTKLSLAVVREHAERARKPELTRLLEPGQRGELGTFLETHHLIDLLRLFPAIWEANSFVAALQPLTPRLYSIASSPLATEGELHLTVSRHSHEKYGTTHLGAASSYLCAQNEDVAVPLYVEENPRFRLPEDAARDIVMIGSGTGVAPFRAFVQERAETGARGRNWLFFGARHFHSQFLYQTEWQQALKRKHLHRLDLAFSRDRADPFYVQHRLAERGTEVYDWLESGAALYVCGAIAMEKDVHAGLCAIASERLGGEERGAEWFSNLRRDGRYRRDVY